MDACVGKMAVLTALFDANSAENSVWLKDREVSTEKSCPVRIPRISTGNFFCLEVREISVENSVR